MGCTQAQNSNRIAIAPMGQDTESLKQFYTMQSQQQDIQREFNQSGATGTLGKSESGEKLIRKDWAKLKQTLAPKNSIQLINCKAMQPLVAKAVGDDQDLKQKVVHLFTTQTKIPLSKIHTRHYKEQQAKENSGTGEDADKQFTDEVEFCIKIAKDQLPMFRKKSKIADLCFQLAQTFAQILEENP